jgi:hypothetical protein
MSGSCMYFRALHKLRSELDVRGSHCVHAFQCKRDEKVN